MNRATPATAALTAVLLALVVVVGGCGRIPPEPAAAGGDLPSGADQSTGASPDPPLPADPPTPTGPPPVQLTPSVADRTPNVPVDRIVGVRAAGGTLAGVAVSYAGKDPKGRSFRGTLPGTLSKDKAAWTASRRLEPSATYTLTMTGANGDGVRATRRSTFSTQRLTLKQQTFPAFYPLAGTTVGVGMPIILRFDVAVRNKKAFQQQLRVVSSPQQAGAWHWYSDTEVHFRPRSYWRPGTKITATAAVNSLNAGGGVYGQQDARTTFTVGRSVVTTVDLDALKATVVINGKTARRIPISGGKKGWLTRSGTKLIMEKLRTTRMTAGMIGASEDYDLKVPYAMRVTLSGEFLHGAPWSTANFGVRNSSHGCVGMSVPNARWLFSRVQIGDPVVTTGTSRGLEQGNGYTDWDLSWSQYQKGSAL